MRTLQDTLRWTLEDRCSAFERQIDRQRAALGGSNPSGLSHALDLFTAYTISLKAEIAVAWDSASDDSLRLTSLRILMSHLQACIELYDDRFSRSYDRVPRSLISLVEKECAAFELPSREAVLTVGPPGNFATFVADLKSILFKELRTQIIPSYLADFNPVMIAIPDLEGMRPSWQPVVVGHELAHYFQRVRPLANQINLQDKLDPARMAAISHSLPQPFGARPADERAVRQVAARWLNELICDAYAVHRYGPAGVTALCEFLESVGSATISSRTHPPGCLRALLLLRWLGQDLTPAEQRMIGPFTHLAGRLRDPAWSAYLCEVFATLSADIQKAIEDWSRFEPYHSRKRSRIVEWLASEFDSGMPGRELFPNKGTPIAVEAPDIVNASWLAIIDETNKPVDRLATKALNNLDFLDKWREAGGDAFSAVTETSVGPEGLVLSEADIKTRISLRGEYAIRVTPQLPGSVHGSSMDVRLGNQFIIFQQSATASFDALHEEQDPRSMQLFVEKAWGDTFHLHPGQLVLASTLEYIALPADISAQVGTRSSYGRLGLISATAVQVHPMFAGCLTLELVNLGEMPLTITPGERIAQLVFMKTSAVTSSEAGKYQFPTGPEFSRIHSDDESTVLRQIRAQYRARRPFTGRLM
jgi:deoxycytidine triphosphate deaminase